MNKSVFKDGNNQAQTNSLLATEKFGKEHRNVLQAIRGSLGPAGNSADLRMFTETAYVCELDFKSPNFGELKPYLSKSPLKNGIPLLCNQEGGNSGITLLLKCLFKREPRTATFVIPKNL